MNRKISTENRGALQLVLGGVRSGKSRFAQQLAAEIGGSDVLFVATAEACDAEMQQRIAHHQQTRPAAWRTLEAPTNIARSIAAVEPAPRVVLVDCLTLLTSNILCQADAESKGEGCDFAAVQTTLETEIDALLQLIAAQPVQLIIVSGEVGAGVVPTHALGRQFRDLLGWANQRLATQAAATYCMVAGIAINATALACSVKQAAANARSAMKVEAPE